MAFDRAVPIDSTHLEGFMKTRAVGRLIGRGMRTRTAMIFAAVLACGDAAAAPTTYEGLVVTDVSLAGTIYRQAEVTIIFTGDTNDIGTFNFSNNTIVPGCLQPQSPDYCGIVKGVTRIRIVSGATRIDATIDPGQVFVALDSKNGGVGFSSFIGPNGFEPVYPLGLDAGSVYSLNGLAAAANVTGKAYSCIGFAPSTTYTCAEPTRFPLNTNRGPLAIYMPYYMSQKGVITWHYDGASLNAGVFSILPTGAED